MQQRTSLMSHPAVVRASEQVERRLRAAFVKSPARRILARKWPPFQFTLPQLAFLGQTMQEATKVEGSIVEIGVSAGNTTIYLNRWLDAIKLTRPYYAVDTFAGFTDTDLAVEVERGNAHLHTLSRAFRTGSKEGTSYRLTVNGVDQVKMIVGDAALIDYSVCAPIAFTLVDVDLYRPVSAALRSVYRLTTPGGIIVIDDCHPSGQFNGAYFAYTEFCAELGVDPVIEHQKLGVIFKPA